MISNPKNTRRKGQALVEFALIVPILVMLVMGIVEFGRIFMTQQTVTNASREGARTGVLPNSTVTDVQNTVSAYMGSAGLTGGTTVQCTNVGPSVAAGTPTSVTVSYSLPILTGTIIPGLGDSITITHSTVMRHE
ncbi:MAG TPA: TadE/TadG family type IV pilus assembly protein [Planctomycetota bacterium]|nr:TadE/TadG family type IV pilus assembly protein [Planctomycetota bacterium]